MKALIAKYKKYHEAGYGKEQVREMLTHENLSIIQQLFILETVFQKKKTSNGKAS